MKLARSPIPLAVVSSLTTVLAVQTTPTQDAPCLSHPEAANIALRWFSIFETDANGTGTGAAIVNNTLTPDFKYFDEGATMGDPAPLYSNSSAVYQTVSGSGYSGALVTDVKYSVLKVFSSCNIIGSRWEGNSVSAKAENVTVPVGTKITYRGNDYLEVDLATRLIYSATSSSDLLNYYKQLGDDVLKGDAKGS